MTYMYYYNNSDPKTPVSVGLSDSVPRTGDFVVLDETNTLYEVTAVLWSKFQSSPTSLTAHVHMKIKKESLT
jgi:hypothetical protein